MHGDAAFDDEPVTGGDAAVVGHAGQCCRQRRALLAGIGQNRHHTSVDADDEAAAAVASGLSECRFE